MLYKRSIFPIFILLLTITSCSKNNPPDEYLKSDISLEQRHRINPNNPPLDPCGDLNLSIAACDCDEQISQAILTAISNFNSLPNVVLNFSIHPCGGDVNGDADIFIRCGSNALLDPCSTSTTSSVTFENWGKTPTILMSSNPIEIFENCCEISLSTDERSCFLQRTMMHELMHTIGFHQTDDLSQEWIAGTLEEDPESIVNDKTCDNLSCEFSDGDIQALEVLYGPCVCPDGPPDDWFEIQGPTTLCAGEEGTFCITGGGLSDWTTTLSSGSLSLALDNENCHNIAFSDPGVHSISIMSCHNDFQDCCINASIEVAVLHNVGECYCVCQYFDTFEHEWIEYSREVVSCEENSCIGGFESNSSRCFVERNCKEIEPDPDTSGCSFCPCTTDTDCPAGFTCQTPNGSSFQICLP